MPAVIASARPSLPIWTRGCACVVVAALVAGCATRAVNVPPAPANPADYAAWDCARIEDEQDAVQQRAAELAYAVDERVGNNVVALGVGLAVFWPAILAMRPDGTEATELSSLKGRYEALSTASRNKLCPPAGADLPARRAAALPVSVGDRLVYEERDATRGGVSQWTLELAALRRDEAEFRRERQPTPWRQDPSGNIIQAPDGSLVWHHLLRREMGLGHVLTGDMAIAGDPLARARIRAQVVAVGPQSLDGRQFDVVVIELYGDALRGEDSTRIDGSMVVDRASGVLLRLDMRCATPAFNVQRRLAHIERGMVGR